MRRSYYFRIHCLFIFDQWCPYYVYVACAAFTLGMRSLVQASFKSVVRLPCRCDGNSSHFIELCLCNQGVDVVPTDRTLLTESFRIYSTFASILHFLRHCLRLYYVLYNRLRNHDGNFSPHWNYWLFQGLYSLGKTATCLAVCTNGPLVSWVKFMFTFPEIDLYSGKTRNGVLPASWNDITE